MKTLVIEDDLKSQCLLAKVLAERGHEVTTFENAEQAILAYQQEFYPLVFVDAGLPGMDGLQFCRWIRSQPKGDRVFMMVATEPNLPQDVSQVLELGANDFLSKPYELNGLRARLSIAEQQMQRFFEQQQLEQALEDETNRWTQIEADMANLRDSYECQLRERDHELATLHERIEQGLSTRGGADEGELARAHEALQRQREESERLATELDAVQQERATRIRELEDQLARSSLVAAEERARREQQETELVGLREQLTARIRNQTCELIELSEQLKTYLDDRKRLDAELNQTRDDLARRARDQMSEVLRLSDELKAATMERRRLEEELAQTQQKQVAELHQRQQELEDTTRRLRGEETKRQQLETALDEARRLVEAAVAERRAAEALLEESVRAEQAQRAESDRLLERLHREEEERRGELIAELDQSQRTIQDRETELTRLGAELGARNGTIRQLEETVATHREARKRVEARCRVLTRLGVELNLAQTPEEVARTLAVQAQDLVGWEVFSLDAYAEEGDWIHPLLNLDKTDGRITEVAPFHPGPQPTSLMRRVLEDGPQLVLRPAPSCSQTDLVVFGDRARRSASLLYLPVKAGHRVVGFLSLRSVALDAYDGDDIEVLMALAAHGAGALQRLESKGRPGIDDLGGRDQPATSAIGDSIPVGAEVGAGVSCEG